MFVTDFPLIADLHMIPQAELRSLTRSLPMPQFTMKCCYQLTIISILFAITQAQPKTSSRKIVLIHLHDDAPFFEDLGRLTLANKRRYTIRHKYELAAHTPDGTEGLWTPCECTHAKAVKQSGGCFRIKNKFEIDDRAPTFGKIKLARRACVGRDGYWLLWSDADAMIVNQTVALESVIDDRYDLGVSVDWLMINAGVILMKCTEWTQSFLKRVYDASEFNDARALDQSAFQHFFDSEPDINKHLFYIPKRLINAYTEEYEPGDFLLHMAGKLYEATTEGATAIANQFDMLSMIDDYEDVAAFFHGRYILNKYSGICVHGTDKAQDSECPPEDEKRLKLKEPLVKMSNPQRYRHVAMRYYWMPDWQDKHDTDDWNAGRKVFQPEKEEADDGDATHDEL